MPTVQGYTSAAVDTLLEAKADLVGGRVQSSQLPTDAVYTAAMTAAIAAAIAVKADLVSGKLDPSQIPDVVITTSSMFSAMDDAFSAGPFTVDYLMTLAAGAKITGTSLLRFEPGVVTNTIISSNTAGTSATDSFRITGDGALAWGNGSSSRDASFGRISAAKIGTSDSDVAINLLGKGLQVKAGTNGKLGTATLVAGTVAVTNTAVTANSKIFLGSSSPAGTQGALYVSAQATGSFTIKSTSSTDTSVVSYLIVEAL